VADQRRFVNQNMMADDCYVSGSRPSPICRRVATETHGHEITQ